ncbi:leucine-rich repeat transmembrane protein FLRT2-like [Anguilla anguilla]|uniref:leucine-rich repeat transmembrane protein FLRT2-like n=1 Tax=Anguilla anguilla TaxID=7936 RepID=UPI0015B2115C|nr:leucine-rich repeat transmembrane protein FLRT2-like [Anguilla anguilla]
MELQGRLWITNCGPSFLGSWITLLISLQFLQLHLALACPKECRCDKIFIYCNERSLTSVPLGIQEGYKTLFLHNNQINNAGFPLELHNVASVETVYLYGNQLDEFPLNLPKNVRVLHLQENNIQTVSRAALAQLSRLEQLHLDDNSISTVGVEEGAFREAVSLKMLFLSKNHLSSIPIGLPEGLKELRLDENRIAMIAEEAFRNVSKLERLLLDGNLLTDHGIPPYTFRDLVNLRELSMARNSLTVPPPLPPGNFLLRLSLQENQLVEIPVSTFSHLNQLLKLDISNNQLQSLTKGVFNGLVNLKQLTVRNNLWRCDCGIRWVIMWLKSLPPMINVRGFMCQSPEQARGMAVRELNLDAVQCPESTGTPSLPWFTPLPTSLAPATVTLPPSPMFSPATPPPLLPIPTTDCDQGGPALLPPRPPHIDPLQISFHVVNDTCIQVIWSSGFPVTAYKVSWAKMGQSLVGDKLQEQTVGGDRRRLDLVKLEPKSTYRICVYILDSFNSYRPGDDTICSEATTKSSPYRPSNKAGGPEQATQQNAGSQILLAGLIGGAIVVVLVVLLSMFCWHMHKRGPSSSKWKYNRGRRKDDYCEAGTKKDNSILEMTETSFQIVSLNNEQLLKGDFRIQPIYTPNGGLGFGDCHLSNSSIAHCKSNVPNADCCHT